MPREERPRCLPAREPLGGSWIIMNDRHRLSVQKAIPTRHSTPSADSEVRPRPLRRSRAGAAQLGPEVVEDRR